MKKSKRGANNQAVIPRSMLPKGAKRVTNAQGERVWLFNGMEFWCKRSLLANAYKAIIGPAPVEATIEGVMPEAAVEVIMNEEKPNVTTD